MRNVRLHAAISVSLGTLCILLAINARSSDCTPPETDGQFWAENTRIKIYIDPSFGTQPNFNERTKIVEALDSWFAQSALQSHGLSCEFVTEDPGASSFGTIRILDDPNGSPDNLAFVDTNVYELSPNKTANATISFNRNYMIADGVPAYAPDSAGAASFFAKLFKHELGHVFGIKDLPAPLDPNSNKENACLQTPGASIMNGFCGTNDQGVGDYPGMWPADITHCDNAQVNSALGSGSGGSGDGGGDGDSGGGGVIDGYEYDRFPHWDYCPPCDWNDETATLTCYC